MSPNLLVWIAYCSDPELSLQSGIEPASVARNRTLATRAAGVASQCGVPIGTPAEGSPQRAALGAMAGKLVHSPPPAPPYKGPKRTEEVQKAQGNQHLGPFFRALTCTEVRRLPRIHAATSAGTIRSGLPHQERSCMARDLIPGEVTTRGIKPDDTRKRPSVHGLRAQPQNVDAQHVGSQATWTARAARPRDP